MVGGDPRGSVCDWGDLRAGPPLSAGQVILAPGPECLGNSEENQRELVRRVNVVQKGAPAKQRRRAGCRAAEQMNHFKRLNDFLL